MLIIHKLLIEDLVITSHTCAHRLILGSFYYLLNYCAMDGMYIISGGSQGIGAAIATKLADHGIPVLALSRKRFISDHPLITPFICDLNNSDSIYSLGNFCADKTIAGLIHSAGIISLAPLAQSIRKEWEQIYNVNVIGAVMLTQALLPALRVSRGRVIFINSSQGKKVAPRWGAYAASKHALCAVAEGLRLEEPDLLVTTIYPGRVNTNMQRNVVSYEKKTYDPALYCDPETLAQAILNIITLPKDSIIEELTIRPTAITSP